MKTFLIRRLRPVAYLEEVTIEVEAPDAETAQEMIEEDDAWCDDFAAGHARIKDGIDHDWSDMYQVMDPDADNEIVASWWGW